MVSAAQLGLQVAPGAMEGSGGRAGLLDVMDAVLMKNLFEVSAEAGAFERLGQEVALQRLVLQVIADVGEALLAILQGC